MQPNQKCSGLAELLFGDNPREEGLLTVLAARPGVGKTALALQAALDLAQAGKPVFFLNLKLTDLQLHARWVSLLSGVPLDRVRRTVLTPGERRRVQRAEVRLRGYPLHVHTSRSLVVGQLPRHLAQLPYPKGTLFGIIDYHQLLEATSSPGGQARMDPLAAIASRLRREADRAFFRLLVLMNLNANVDRRRNREPRFSDFRDHWPSETTADRILLARREEGYSLTLRAASDRSGPRGFTARVELDPETLRPSFQAVA